MLKPYPCLWFDGPAEDAARFYTSIFPDSRIDKVVPAAADVPDGRKGDISVTRSEQGLTVTLEIERKMQTKDANQSISWVQATVTFELKYEGRVNGKDCFSCVQVTSQTSSDGGPHSLQCWGASNESLKQRYASFVAG